MNAAIRLEGVQAVRQGKTVLDIPLLEVTRGEFLGIIGPNGSGKTTLLGVLAGRLAPQNGSVHLSGSDQKEHGKVAIASQMSALDPRLPISVLESVMVGAYAELGLLHRPGHAVRARAREMLSLVGIAHLENRPIGRCSGGEAQRAAIARALLQRPDILLLDEPTSALDWRAQREILDCIKDIHTRLGLTTLMVTHDLNALPVLCDRVLALRDGRVVWNVPSHKALEPARLSDIFNTPFVVLSHEDRPVVLF
jgi:ABC-type cobalamin/Fe3+-siderophores transport system ATPase subunit